MRTHTSYRLLLPIGLILTAACAGVMPAGQPGGKMARFSRTDRDPVGFLLLNRDSLGIPDSTVQRLVQLNLRMFRRNQALQNQIDSATHDVRINPRERSDSSHVTPAMHAVIDPLREEIRAQTAAVKDTAWAFLTEGQRVRADSLDARQSALMRRGAPPNVSGNGQARP